MGMSLITKNFMTFFHSTFLLFCTIHSPIPYSYSPVPSTVPFHIPIHLYHPQSHSIFLFTCTIHSHIPYSYSPVPSTVTFHIPIHLYHPQSHSIFLFTCTIHSHIPYSYSPVPSTVPFHIPIYLYNPHYSYIPIPYLIPFHIPIHLYHTQSHSTIPSHTSGSRAPVSNYLRSENFQNVAPEGLVIPNATTAEIGPNAAGINVACFTLVLISTIFVLVLN